MNDESNRRQLKPSPYLNANFISKMFQCWISPLMALGANRPLNQDDMYQVIPDEQCERVTNQLESEWLKEKARKKKRPSFFNAIFRMFGLKIFLINLIPILIESLNFLQPFLIVRVLDYFKGTSDLESALIYGGLSCAISSFNSLMVNPFWMKTFSNGLRLNIAITGLAFKKMTKLNLSFIEDQAQGQIINLISSDVRRIEIGTYNISFLIIGPLMTIVSLYLLARLIDITFLFGAVVLVVILIFQILGARFYDTFRRITLKKFDKRINVISEVLNGIKIIKMQTWEKNFRILVEKLRKRELKYQKYLFAISGFNKTVDFGLYSLLTYTSVSFFLWLTNKPLLSAYVIFATSYYLRACSGIGHFFVKAVLQIVSARVSIKRVEDFLLLAEREDPSVPENGKEVGSYVKIDNYSAKWTNIKSDQFSLKNISLTAWSNELVTIIGPVGSGKTSLLLAILNEMTRMSGSIVVNGTVFYVPQEPWIFSSTIKQNILFGRPYEKEKFERIVDVCSLRHDLDQFENRENTLIGEKGINLSGGQRARINMARALYSDAQIYLFDDPLSAVDANVAKHLMEECINGYLRERTRILVTHQTHQLVNVRKINLIENGEIKFSGDYESLRKSGIKLEFALSETNSGGARSQFSKISALMKPPARQYVSQASVGQLSMCDGEEMMMLSGSGLLDNNGNDFDDETSHSTNSITNANANANQEQKQKELNANDEKKKKRSDDDNLAVERQTTGAVKWKTFFIFFTTGGGVFCFLLDIIIVVSSNLLLKLSDLYLSSWASIEENNLKSNHTLYLNNMTNLTSSTPLNHQSYLYAERSRNFMIYSTIVCLLIVLAVIHPTFYFYLCLKTSKKIHSIMFDAVLRSPIRFFENNPLGRILNRFSKDINQADESIPYVTIDLFLCVLNLFTCLIVSVYINYFILVPMIPLTIIYIYYRNYFIKSSRELKRLDGILKSPIFVHLSQTISGIAVIRANRAEPAIVKEFYQCVDDHTSVDSTLISANRWISNRLDLVSNLYVLITVFGCILLKNYLQIDPGQVGILFVYLTRMIGLFQWCIRQSCEVENSMTSFERILDYTRLRTESLDECELEPDSKWPQRGEIHFEKVSYSYDKDQGLPNVLNELTFTIKPSEKVGIIGRTGAGKSTIIQTLFRMSEPDGSIFIDGVDIKKISLHRLRNKLAIIPQEPYLFQGCVRNNLDPFDEYADSELWSALEQVQLKNVIQEMDGGLEAEVAKGGNNFSIGQKQLICLARAILKKSKILLIDEATANVDFKTDELIQKSIRVCFKNCTVITIAHRLQTIADNDRLICLESGRIKNIGNPGDLLEDKSSLFYELVQRMEPNEKSRIMKMSKRSKLMNINADVLDHLIATSSKQQQQLQQEKDTTTNETEPFIPK